MPAWIRACALAVVLGVACASAAIAQPQELARRAEAEFDVGHGAEAVALWRQALSGHRAAGDAQGELRVLLRLGTTLGLLGRHAEASAVLAEALPLARRSGAAALENEVLARLADSASRARNDELAITANRELLARAEASGDAATAAVAAARLGQALLATGRSQAAATAFRRAAELFAANRARANEAAALRYLGDALLRQEDYVGANDAYRRATGVAVEAAEPGLQAEAMHGSGLALYLLGDYPSATQTLKDAIGVARRSGQGATEASALMTLGNVEYFRGRTTDAIAGYDAALQAAGRLKDPALEGKALGNLGLAWMQAGQYDRSADYFERAAANSRARGDRLDEARALGNFGAQLIRQGRYADAIGRLSRSSELARETGSRRAEAVALRNLGFAQLRNGQAGESEASLRRAIALQEALREQAKAIDSFNLSLFETQRDAYSTLQAALVAQNRPNDALQVAESGRARSLADLLAHRGGAAVAPAPSLETIRDFARARRVTLVEFSFVPADEALYAWVVRPDGTIHFRRTELKVRGGAVEAALESLVRDARASLGAVVPRDVPGPRPGADGRDDLLSVFHQLLIAPVVEWWPTSPDEVVVLVPQGPLFLLPFAALRDARGRMLIDSHALLVVPSIQTLVQLAGKRAPPGGRAFVAGNPAMSDIRLGPKGSRVVRFEPLPGAEREAIAVAALLDTRPLIGREFTKAALFQSAPSARVIHLATHGSAEDLRGSGVAGALVLAAGERDDGLLTTPEIMELRLQADLVVLSACNTGLGSIGSDGVIGVARAFIAAGAHSVVVSLWSVPDQPTAELMQDFHRRVASAPNKAIALRDAMLAMRAKDPNPLSWAGFMLVGASE